MTTTTTPAAPKPTLKDLRYVYGQHANSVRYLDNAPYFVGTEQMNEARKKAHDALTAVYDAGGNINDQPWEVVKTWFA